MPDDSIIPLQHLLLTVEGQLLPRLIELHRTPAAPLSEGVRDAHGTTDGQMPVDHWATAKHIHEFSNLAVADDTSPLREHLHALLEQGVALSSLYLELLGPAALHLGTRWEQDGLDFMDVTMGIYHLHMLVAECEPLGSHTPANRHRSILLTNAPGDEHTLGLSMVADFFRREGWQVTHERGLAADDLCALVHTEPFNAIGFSKYAGDSVTSLRAMIRQTRAAVRNPATLILVGGQYFRNQPDAVGECGADFWAADAHQAVLLAAAAVRLCEGLAHDSKERPRHAAELGHKPPALKQPRQRIAINGGKARSAGQSKQPRRNPARQVRPGGPGKRQVASPAATGH